MLARGGLRRQRDCPWARVETESSREHSMMARSSLMQRVTWALTGSATLFVVVLCAVFYLSFGQMEDDLVNAVLVTEAEQVLGQLKQGPDRSEENTSELQSLMHHSYAVFCLKKTNPTITLQPIQK